MCVRVPCFLVCYRRMDTTTMVMRERERLRAPDRENPAMPVPANSRGSPERSPRVRHPTAGGRDGIVHPGEPAAGDIDYRPQCVAHALQVREFHSMLGRGARTSTLLGLGLGLDTRWGARNCQFSRLQISHAHGMHVRVGYRLPSPMRGSCASSA